MKLDLATGRRIPRMNDASLHQSYDNENLRIISDDLFKSANAKLATRKHGTNGSARTAKLIRPWTGHLFCEECGSAFYNRKSANSKGVYFYIVCGCRMRRGPEACSNSLTLREDLLLASLQEACSFAFDNIEQMVDEAMVEARQTANTNREDATRLKSQIAELNKESEGYGRLLVDPELSAGSKKEIDRLMSAVAVKRDALVTALDQLHTKANDDTEQLADIIREKLMAARSRWESLAGPAHLNSLIAEFVGPSLVSSDGKLLAVEQGEQGAIKCPVPAGAVHGAIAGAGFEPATSGL